jgi:hypothetical protein
VGSYPTVDESFERLHKAGWSVGDAATPAGWCVSGTNGENRIEARGGTQAEVWWRACEAARAVGMLARMRRTALRPWELLLAFLLAVPVALWLAWLLGWL